ncbi:MAG: cytochrome [Bdellovibrionota bacterium]
MFLQGNLQVVFDALFTVGAIDPVLKMDWTEICEEMKKDPDNTRVAFDKVNSCRGDYTQLISTLNELDQKSVHYIAMEVAREFCEFHDRQSLQ